jgi:hypothetical protein
MAQVDPITVTREAEYAPRDDAHAAVNQASRTHERALTKAADAARLAANSDRIRSEVRVGVKPPAGKLVAVDVAARLLLGPAGAVRCGGALVPTLEGLTGSSTVREPRWLLRSLRPHRRRLRTDRWETGAPSRRSPPPQ